MTGEAKAIAEACRWWRRLGNSSLEAPFCHIVANPAYPQVWDANHADAVTAQSDVEIASVFAAMDGRLGHTRWRVVYTDVSTPDPFVARLAMDGFREQPVTIQMLLGGEVSDRGAAVEIRPVVDGAGWEAMQRLVALDHAEGQRTHHLDLTTEFSTSMVASYRSKSASCRFHLVVRDGEPIAYGAFAMAPNGMGMIDDLFTLPAERRRGVATAMIAAFSEALRSRGCRSILLGALASERPKHLYARLGFRPFGLARCWVAEGAAPM